MKTGHKKLTGWTAALSLAALLSAPAAAETTDVLERTHSLAASASTVSQHADVARRYRQHAETFAARAAEHEKNVREMARSAGAAFVKWPGLASGSLQAEKSKALEARRAERETRELAERHLRLSVEALAPQAGAVAGE